MPFSNSYATIARWSCRRVPSGLMLKMFLALLLCGIGVVASAYAQAPSPRGRCRGPEARRPSGIDSAADDAGRKSWTARAILRGATNRARNGQD